MYKEHPDLNLPPSDAVLWRYLDFTKFVSLLDKTALFFARADKLGDPFEGAFSKVNVALRPLIYKDKIPEHMLKNVFHLNRESRRFTLVSCWNWSGYESAAMWKLYSREHDGIAIRTDFKSFKESFTCSEDIFIGRVAYVDYETNFIDERNLLAPYLSKRKSFEHENEVRALNIAFPTHNGKIDLSQDVYDVGTYYEVDLSLLIKEVIVAPYAEDWLVELVQSVAARYTLKAPISRSSLADAPTWG